MAKPVEELVRRWRREPKFFLRAFATPDENNNAFTIKGLLKAVYQLGYTEEDLIKASWIAVGFKPGFLKKDSDASSSTAAVTNEAAEPFGSPQLSMKAPVGLYKITKLGDKTSDIEELGFFELRPHKSGWNHRRCMMDDQEAEAEIHWASSYVESDPKQVWRLSTTIEHGSQYDLAFWVDFADASHPFKFAGTTTAGDGGTEEELEIEGVMDDELYSSFGGFIGRMIHQLKSSHKPSPPPPEHDVVFMATTNGPGGSPAIGMDIGSGVAYQLLDMLARMYLMRIHQQNLQAAPPPHDVQPVRSQDDRDLDDMLEEDMERLQAKMKKQKERVYGLESCKIMLFDFGDDKKDPDPGTGPGPGPLPGPSTGQSVHIAVQGSAIFAAAGYASKGVKKACDAIVNVVGQPLRDKATDLIMASLTTLNEEHQVVEPAKNPIIDWPTVIQSAITKTCPKTGDPARTIAEFQDAYLSAIRQSITPILMSYLTPVYSSLASQPGTSDILDYFFTHRSNFANYTINDTILKTMTTEKVFDGIISETIRTSLVKQKGLGPMTSTTAQESFKLQLQGLQTASEVQQDYVKSIDSIAKLLKSGELTLQNADTVLREKLNMVAVQPGMYTPAAPPSQWFETADALRNMGMMIGLTAGYRGSKGGKDPVLTGKGDPTNVLNFNFNNFVNITSVGMNVNVAKAASFVG